MCVTGNNPSFPWRKPTNWPFNSHWWKYKHPILCIQPTTVLPQVVQLQIWSRCVFWCRCNSIVGREVASVSLWMHHTFTPHCIRWQNHVLPYYLRCIFYRTIDPRVNSVFLSGKFTKEGATTDKNKGQNGSKKSFSHRSGKKSKNPTKHPARRNAGSYEYSSETRCHAVIFLTLHNPSGDIYLNRKGNLQHCSHPPECPENTNCNEGGPTLTAGISIYWKCCTRKVWLPSHLLESSTKCAMIVIK